MSRCSILGRCSSQPVAIAITSQPETPSSYHGATLSSFTSLTLHPYPLVAFSVRLPSRLADYLRPASTAAPSTTTTSESRDPEIDDVTPTLTPDPLAAPSPPGLAGGKKLNISLLSTSHEPIALDLSRPGADHSHIFSAAPFTLPTIKPSTPDATFSGSSNSKQIEATASLPILPDAIGNISCEVVSSTLLKDVCPSVVDEEKIDFDDEVEGAGLFDVPPTPAQAAPEGTASSKTPSLEGGVHGSELFICRVLSVEGGSGKDSPLLYLKQKYTTASV